MKHNVFAVYDTKANAYLTPFFLPTVGMAVRVFSDCVNSDSHQFGAHPEDYTLFQLGIWDDATCQFEKLETKKAIHNGVELVNDEPASPLVTGNGDSLIPPDQAE